MYLNNNAFKNVWEVEAFEIIFKTNTFCIIKNQNRKISFKIFVCNHISMAIKKNLEPGEKILIGSWAIVNF